MSTFDLGACIEHAKGEIETELSPRFVPNSVYDETHLAPCASSLKARAALCIQQDLPGSCALFRPVTIRESCDGLVHGTLAYGAPCDATQPGSCLSANCNRVLDKSGYYRPGQCTDVGTLDLSHACLGKTCPTYPGTDGNAPPPLHCVVDECEYDKVSAGGDCTFIECGSGLYCAEHDICAPLKQAGEVCHDQDTSDPARSCIFGYCCTGSTVPQTCEPCTGLPDQRGVDLPCRDKIYPYRADSARCAQLGH